MITMKDAIMRGNLGHLDRFTKVRKGQQFSPPMEVFHTLQRLFSGTSAVVNAVSLRQHHELFILVVLTPTFLLSVSSAETYQTNICWLWVILSMSGSIKRSAECWRVLQIAFHSADNSSTAVGSASLRRVARKWNWCH